MKKFHEDIVACYLYPITKHGYPPKARDSLRHLEEFADLGYRSVELEGIHEKHLGEMAGLAERIQEKKEALGMKIPIFCVVLPGLCAAEDKVREKNLELFEQGCKVAKLLGARAVLDNAPIPPWEFPGDIPVTRHYDDEVLASATLPADLQWDRYWDALVETFRTACMMAEDHGLTYQLHPCHGALVQNTDAYLLFAEAVGSDALKLNFDTANQFFLKDNLFLSLIRLKEHVDYIHISDNPGHKVEHLAVGDGQIHWERFLETLDRIGYKGQFGIDIGGAESDVPELDRAYRDAALWLEESWFSKRS